MSIELLFVFLCVGTALVYVFAWFLLLSIAEEILKNIRK